MLKKQSYIVLFLVIATAMSCSTEKDKRLNKFYHNTTAYYNGYFNAREIIKVTKKDFDKNTVEDYSELIPVNRYPDEEQSKAFFPEMNRAIDKTSTVINKHAMPNEKKGKNARKEYGNWIDENWLIMGVSYFYKREYPAAIEKFEYIVKMYPKDESKYYAKLWLARTYIEMGDYPTALKYINEIEVEKEAKELKEAKEEKRKKRGKKYSKKKKRKKSRGRVKTTKKREEVKESKSFLVKFPKKMRADFYATSADLNLRTGEYKKAIQFLDSAISYEKSKKLRVRYSFIQAQLQQELGNNSKASELYSYVIKKNANYQMAFYAKINRALLADNRNRGELKKELLKLAKDEKYIEFRDQIFYALADLELQEFRKEQGINYLEKSASYPPSNKSQKGKTFMRLADVYFNDQEYVPAQKYYDSTLLAIDKKSAKYAEIKEKNESLTRLVGYINNIVLQDSLIKIALLPEKQRRDKVEDILYKQKIQKLEEERLKQQELNNARSPSPNLQAGNIGQKGSFWIYNESNKESGQKSFKSIWGTIKLEDNWRRSNKNQSDVAGETEVNNSPVVKDEEIDAFLAKLPTSKNDLENARLSIINSNYLSGLIYTNVLKNSKEAIKSFKDNKKRFHPNNKITPSLYQLYVLYQELGKSKDILATKNFILENYPESKEAKIIKDPSYASKLKKGEEKFQTSYAKAYKLVEANQNQAAISYIETLLNDKDPNPFECKLRFLKSKVYANTGDRDSLEKALAQVVENCPNSEIGNIAEVALGKLRNQKLKKENQKVTAYLYEPKETHYFAIVVPLNEDINKLKIALSNFNSTSFDEKGLKTSAIGLNSKQQTILVKQFASKEEAHSYYIAFKVNPDMRPFVTRYQYFTITPKNYSTLFVSKELAKYINFYNINYL